MNTSQCSSPPCGAGLKRRPLFQSFAALLLTLACLAGGVQRAQAQSFAGSSVDLKGVTYTYNSSYTDGSGHQVDSYDGPEYSGYGTTTFTGTDFGGVATVYHAYDGNGMNFSGYWTGSYTDAHTESDISGDGRSYNGNYYTGTWLAIDYSLNSSGALVYTSSATYTGGNGSFTAYVGQDGTGSISGTETGVIVGGTETGVIVGGTWYVNNVQSLQWDARTYNGVNYQGNMASTTYSLSNGAAVSDYYADYMATNGYSGSFYVHIGPSGSGEITGSVAGFVYNGTWYVNGETDISGDYRYYNDSTYQGTTAANNYSLVNGVVVNNYYATYNGVYGGTGGSFTVHIGPDGSGEITGVVTGFVLSYSWYVNSTYSISYDSRWYENVHYQGTTASDTYSLVDGAVQHDYYAYYNNVDGGGGPFSVHIGPNGMGSISGNVSGVVYNGSWLVNYGGIVESPGTYPPSPLFNRYYSFSNGYYYVSYQSDGSAITSHYETFTADGSASVTVTSNSSSPVSLSGNDPAIGSFTGVYTNTVWESTTTRSSPTFAPATVYNPTTPVRWKSGTLNFSGDVADYYATDDNSFMMVVSGNLYALESQGSYYAASVGVTTSPGASGSYYLSNSTFSVGGYDIRVTQKNSTYTPHTQASLGAQTYYVNGRQLNWSDGGDYDDGDGNTSSSDNYSNGSTGDYMSLGTMSNTTNPGIYVNLMFSGRSYGGYDFNFGVNNAPEVSTSSRTLAGGPPAFWLGSHGSYGYGQPYGIYYQRVAEDSPYYYADSNQWLILTGSNGNFSVHSYNSNDWAGYQTFDFAFNGQAGIFSFTDYYGVHEFGFAADGNEILIPALTPPTDLPPAIFISGFTGNYVFVGTAPDRDNTAETLAYYALPSFSTTPSWQGVRAINLLTIRLSDNAVTLVQTDNTQTTGSYDTQTHLFQVNPSNPLPTPIYGVDPLNNNMPWGLATPPSGLPATAVINGQFWRFINVDGDGVAHYVGAYPGQTLTLTPNNTRPGLYDVALTNPYGSNDTGEFHNFTFTMDGGTGIISGNGTGGTIDPLAIARQSFAGDIDIFGNVLSLGALKDDPGVAGLTMSFADDLTTSSLSIALARPSSAWTWSHPGSLNSSVLLPAMKLDASHRLGLYSPTDATAPAIVLDPAGTSSFKEDVSVKGTLRVKARGDLGMGSFTNGPQP